MSKLEALNQKAKDAREHLERMQDISSATSRVAVLVDRRLTEAWNAYDAALEALAKEALKGQSGTSVPPDPESA